MDIVYRKTGFNTEFSRFLIYKNKYIVVLTNSSQIAPSDAVQASNFNYDAKFSPNIIKICPSTAEN